MLNKNNTIKLLEIYLSKSRFESYINLCNKLNLKYNKIIKLYRINLLLSKELYGLISNFEVLFRNVINEEMIKYFGIDWFNKIK